MSEFIEPEEKELATVWEDQYVPSCTRPAPKYTLYGAEEGYQIYGAEDFLEEVDYKVLKYEVPFEHPTRINPMFNGVINVLDGVKQCHITFGQMETDGIMRFGAASPLQSFKWSPYKMPKAPAFTNIQNALKGVQNRWANRARQKSLFKRTRTVTGKGVIMPRGIAIPKYGDAKYNPLKDPAFPKPPLMPLKKKLDASVNKYISKGSGSTKGIKHWTNEITKTLRIMSVLPKFGWPKEDVYNIPGYGKVPKARWFLKLLDALKNNVGKVSSRINNARDLISYSKGLFTDLVGMFVNNDGTLKVLWSSLNKTPGAIANYLKAASTIIMKKLGNFATDAAADIKRYITDLGKNIKNFFVALQKSLTDDINEMRAWITDDINKITVGIRADLTNVQKYIQSVITGLQGNITSNAKVFQNAISNEFQVRLKEFNTYINKVKTDFTKNITNMRNSIQAEYKKLYNQLNTRIASATTQIKNARAEFEKRTAAVLKQITDVRDEVFKHAAVITQHATEITNLKEEIKRLTGRSMPQVAPPVQVAPAPAPTPAPEPEYAPEPTPEPEPVVVPAKPSWQFWGITDGDFIGRENSTDY